MHGFYLFLVEGGVLSVNNQAPSLMVPVLSTKPFSSSREFYTEALPSLDLLSCPIAEKIDS